MKQFEVIDNFLSIGDWQDLYDNIKSNRFLWSKNPSFIPGNEPVQLKEYFSFCNNAIYKGEYFKEFDKDFDYTKILLDELRKKQNISNFEIIRSKANLFLRTNENLKLGLHYDVPNDDTYETLLYFINDNNGGVEFEDGTFIKQKENRALIMYGRLKHQSVTQTDTRERYNININYFRR